MAVVLAVHVQSQVLVVPVIVLALLPGALLAVGALVSSAVGAAVMCAAAGTVTSVAVRNSTFTIAENPGERLRHQIEVVVGLALRDHRHQWW